MSFQQISSPGERTLRDKYRELVTSDDPNLAEAGDRMFKLLDCLEGSFVEDDVWALTSHYELKLLPTYDSWRPWYISIAPPIGDFVVEYLMPQESAPWPGARVIGEAASVDDALKMIRVAMVKCGGWQPNQSPQPPSGLEPGRG